MVGLTDPFSFECNHKHQALGLRSSLPPGRQNGLANILRTVQALVREALTADASADADAPAVAAADKKQQRRAAVLPAVESFSSTDVAVLLSGGVDSSVALSLLQKQARGVRVVFVFGEGEGFWCMLLCATLID